MNICLEKAKEENKNVLYRLLEYSLYEESANDLNEMNEDAIFEYKYFNSYFTDDDRVSIISVDEKYEIDSSDYYGSDYVPLRNLFNDMYAKDISKK